MFQSNNLAVVLTLLSIFSSTNAAEFSIKQETSGDITVLIDGTLFTRYVTSDTVTNKCYLYPVIGPGEIPMTRAFPMEKIAGEKQDHPHHRSICFGLMSADGLNTWAEPLSYSKNGVLDAKKQATMGRQVHTKVITATASGNAATLVVESNNLTSTGDVYMRQTRTMQFFVADNGSRIIDFDITLEGVKDQITILDKKDSGFSIRVAHDMSVDAGKGGRIITSTGLTNKDAWGKRATWVDFNGPIKGKTMGIAMLNHPSSFRHPTPWHVRTYGLLTANPFALQEIAKEKESGDVVLKKDQVIHLKHRIILHEGDETAAHIAEAWTEYAK